jgi:hypothetical protein
MREQHSQPKPSLEPREGHNPILDARADIIKTAATPAALKGESHGGHTRPEGRDGKRDASRYLFTVLDWAWRRLLPVARRSFQFRTPMPNALLGLGIETLCLWLACSRFRADGSPSSLMR